MSSHLISLLPCNAERWFWVELSSHNSSIIAEFGGKNSSMIPHPPLYKPIPLFFWPHVYGLRRLTTYFPLICCQFSTFSSIDIALILSYRVLSGVNNLLILKRFLRDLSFCWLKIGAGVCLIETSARRKHPSPPPRPTDVRVRRSQAEKLIAMIIFYSRLAGLGQAWQRGATIKVSTHHHYSRERRGERRRVEGQGIVGCRKSKVTNSLAGCVYQSRKLQNLKDPVRW